MATIIDALVVTLGLDAKGYTAGSKQATKSLKDTGDEAARVAKDMEARGKQAAMFFSKLRNEALALLTVFTAGVGIKNFVEGTITSSASLGRMSENLNMSAQDLAEWQLANKNAGGSVEGMTSQLKESAQSVAAFKNGMMNDGTHQSFFYGLKQEDLKDGESYLLARSKIISEAYKKNPQDAQFKALKMGISEESFNLLKQGPDAIKRLRDEQSKLADEQARASIPMEEFRKKLDTLKNNFEAIGVKILTSLMPQFDRFTNWLSSHQADIETWANKAVSAIETFVKWANEAAESVGGWKNVLIGLLALKVATMVAPLISLAAALLSVGSALGVVALGTGGLAILAALAAIGGYKAAEWIDHYLHPDDKAPAKAPASYKSTRYPTVGLKTKDELHAEASRQRVAAGLPALPARKNTLFSDLEAKYELPSGLLDSVWKQESDRGKNMLSPAGAKGHFGFMDATAKQYGLKNPNDLIESSDAAARMYRDLLKQNGGNLPMALAGYNWGSGNLAKKGFGAAPAETRNYIDQVTGRMKDGDTAPDRTVAMRNAANTVSMVNAAQAPSRSTTSNSSTSTSETNINGPIHIVTQATDAAGIARDMSQQLGKMAFAAQANTGLQ